MALFRPSAPWRLATKAVVGLALVAILAVLIEAHHRSANEKKTFDSLFTQAISHDDMPTGSIPKRRK